jgi:SagB-type dehydrogenase family enzyme
MDSTPSRHHTMIAYHERTKHHFDRYARSAGYMDWNNQPNPFRLYEGAARIDLPLATPAPAMTYGQVYAPVREPGVPISHDSVGLFLEYTMGISAWKAAGQSRWALRVNPSSGNLHPTECHLIMPPAPGLPGGIYHYSPLLHALEKRASLPPTLSDLLQCHFSGPGFLVALSTIFWRESWKYGERAYRYCNLDGGHALAALALGARLNHWRMTGVSGAGDDQIGTLLGFHQTDWAPLEAEVPEMICWVAVDNAGIAIPRTLSEELTTACAGIPFAGRPNRLSRKPVDWSAITRAADAARKPADTTTPDLVETPPSPVGSADTLSAGSVFQRRRSAVSYNPNRTIPADTFLAILDRTRPRSGQAPFDAAMTSPAVQLLLFVHRVEDLAPGLYLFNRAPRQLEAMRSACREEFLWRPAAADLPLYLLREGDMTRDAMTLSCHQDIAGDSAVALAMLAPFGTVLENRAHLYRHLHWECGMIGQVLYLEATAQGLGGTGIGCFFDDGVHELLGLKDNAFQDLYHFTIGHPIEDTRVTTLPAYHHLERPTS